MTKTKSFLAGFIFGTIMLFGFCGSPFAESYPTDPEGKALQIEMSAYIDKYVLEVGITPDTMRWTTLVMPILEMDSPAITYGWALPPKGETVIWLAVFTFHHDYMLMLDTKSRRVVAGHEVGHMTGRCMSFPYPILDGLSEMEAMWADFNYAVVTESCADIVSAELTSADDVLDTLEFLRDNMSAGKGNPVLVRRIQVMERVIERSLEHE